MHQELKLLKKKTESRVIFMPFIPKKTKNKEPAGYKSLYIKKELVKKLDEAKKIIRRCV